MNDGLTQPRYEEIIRDFQQRRLLVIGDLMIDEYLRGSVRRISQEGPVLVVEVETEEFKPGGAANVGNNLRALGAGVAVVGVVGDDEMGKLLCRDLAANGIDVSGILVDSTRPTTRKTRVVAQGQQVLRIDREQTHALSDAASDELLAHVSRLLGEADAVLVSDYRKGVVTPGVARELTAKSSAAGKPLITNPKPTSAPWLSGARLLSLNHFEAEELGRARLPDNDDDLRAYGESILRDLQVDTLVITQGARGLGYWRHDGEYRHVPAHIVAVADGAGAGDTAISAMALALACCADTYEAAVIAIRASACVVRKPGVATVDAEELLAEDGRH